MARARPRVLITARLPERPLDRLAVTCDLTVYDGVAAMPRDRLLAQVAGKAGTITLLTDQVDEEFLAAAGPRLSVVANYAGGFGNIDLDACTRRGILATNAPDVLADTAAGTAFALMIGAARQAAGGDRLPRPAGERPAGPSAMPGQDVRHILGDVHGRTLGVVGFGRIGQALARLADGYSMTILYYHTGPVPPEVQRGLNAHYRDLEDLLCEADFVSLHTNLSRGTGYLINAERLAMMKPTAVLVNASGVPVVDEQALACALRAGRLYAAGIDVLGRGPQVYADLLECRNAMVVRHLGSATVPARLAIANLAVDNLLAGLHGERPPGLLNPQAWLQRSSPAAVRNLTQMRYHHQRLGAARSGTGTGHTGVHV